MRTTSIIGTLAVTAGTLSYLLVHSVNAGSQPENMWDVPFALRATHSVSIKNLQFNPGTLDMAVGDTVTWTNNETDGTVHNITSDENVFVSPDVPPGATFSFTPSSAGTYNYHCRFHPQTIGTLNVGGGSAPPPGQPAPPPPPPPPPPQPAPEPPPDDPGGGGGLPIPGLPELPGLPIQQSPAPGSAPASGSGSGSSNPAAPVAPGTPPGSFDALIDRAVRELLSAMDR